MTTALTDLLSLVNAHVLAAIARRRGVALAPIPQLAAALAQPEGIRRIYDSLPPADKALLDRLLIRGEDIAQDLQIEMTEHLRLATPDLPSPVHEHFRYVASPKRTDSSRFSDIYARLLEAGLVFTLRPSYFSQPPYNFSPGVTICAADEVRAALPAPTSQLTIVEDRAIVTRLTTRPTLVPLRLFAIWEYIQRQPLRRTMQGAIRRTDLRKMERATNLSGGAMNDDEATRLADFMVYLSSIMEVVASPDDEVIGAPRPSVFSLSTEKLWTQCVDAAMSAARAEQLIGMAIADGVFWDANKALHRLLIELPPGVWIELPSFLQRVRLRVPDLLRSRLEQVKRPDKEWRDFEDRYVTQMLRGPLAWLAVCDVAVDKVGQIHAFRMSAETQALLKTEQPAEVPQPGLIVVQPTFQIIALPPLSFDRLRQMVAFADLVKIGEAPEFKLTRASLYRAAQRELSLETIVELLQGWSKTPLPANVQREMNEWVGRHARIILRHSGPLLQTDETLLDELLADPALAPFFARRLAPTVAELTGGLRFSASQLREILLARGQLPMRIRSAAPGGGWEIDASGELRSTAVTPDPLWRPALERVAEPVTPAAPRQLAAVWKITPEKVRAIRDDKKAPAYVELLRKVVQADLPADLLQQIERWSRPEETAQIGAAILLQVSTAETAAQLLADRSLRGALRPLPNADNTWLLVKEEALPKVQARLAAWEVRVKEEAWK